MYIRRSFTPVDCLNRFVSYSNIIKSFSIRDYSVDFTAIVDQRQDIAENRCIFVQLLPWYYRIIAPSSSHHRFLMPTKRDGAFVN